MPDAIKIENLSKRYTIRHGTSAGSLKELVEHLRRKFAKKLGQALNKNSESHYRANFRTRHH